MLTSCLPTVHVLVADTMVHYHGGGARGIPGPMVYPLPGHTPVHIPTPTSDTWGPSLATPSLVTSDGHHWKHTPPHHEQTPACENITIPQSLLREITMATKGADWNFISVGLTTEFLNLLLSLAKSYYVIMDISMEIFFATDEKTGRIRDWDNLI